MLHGSSSVPQEYVKIINTHGGALKDAVGIPEEQPRKAAKSAVCKINIDSDGRLAMTAAIRKIFVDQPAEFDPRKYLGPARDELKKLYMHKCESVLGSAGKGLIRNISDKETRSFETGFFVSGMRCRKTAAPEKRVAGAEFGRKATRRHRIYPRSGRDRTESSD